MTCIVGVVKGDTVWLGGDRAATNGSLTRTIIKEPKIFLKGDIGFGVCGLPKVMDALQHAIELPEHVKGDDKAYLVSELIPAVREGLKKQDAAHEEPGYGTCFQGAMLIAYRGSLYELQCNFQLVESAEGFRAVGSGGEAAMGALRASRGMDNARKRVLEALQTSAEVNAGVAPPFDVICVKTRIPA